MQSLLTFEAAARLGNFSRAADELALTQSAVSHQIQTLEDWVRQPLFRRVGRGVALTGAGEVFLQTVRATIRLLSEGRDRIEPYRNLNSVLLWCPHGFAEGWLMQRLPALHAAFPGLEVWVVTEDEQREFDRIDVDLIVSPRIINSDEVVATPFLQDERVAVCHPGLAQQLAALPFPQLLEHAPLIYDETQPEWAPWLADFRQQGLVLQRGPTFDDAGLLIDAAELGLGIAMVSKLRASKVLAQGRLVVLPQLPVQVLEQYWLMKPAAAPRTPVAEQVFNWLLETA